MILLEDGFNMKNGDNTLPQVWQRHNNSSWLNVAGYLIVVHPSSVSITAGGVETVMHGTKEEIDAFISVSLSKGLSEMQGFLKT